MAEVKASDISVWNGSSWVSIRSGKVGFFNGVDFIFDRSKIRVCGGDGNLYYAEIDSITTDGSGAAIEALGMGDSITITVISNGNWSTTKNAAWLSASPSSGAAGTFSVDISVTKNPSPTTSRTGKVTFICGTASAVVTIIQLGYAV